MTYAFKHDDRIACWATHTETMEDLGIVVDASGQLMAFAVAAIPASVAAAPPRELTSFKATHRHYKGGLYSVIGVALAMYQGVQLVIYRGADLRAWARPKVMFDGTLEDGTLRFTPLAG